MNHVPRQSDTIRLSVALGFLILLSFFAGLGSGPLFDVDEGAFSEATREMLVGKNYLTTFLNGKPRFDKPILIYWLQLVSVRTFGLSEFAFRFPSAVSSALWAITTFLFVRKERNDGEAWLAASLMVLSLQITIIAKAAIADALLNCCLAISMFAIYRYRRLGQASSIYLAFGAIGLGMLAKGPIALLIPLAVSFVFFLLQRDLNGWMRAVSHPGGMLLFLLIVLPWYTLEYLDQGKAFLEGFFMKHNVGRFSSSLEGHSGSLFYYVPVVLLGIMPSTGLFFVVLRHLRTLVSDPLNRFCLVWFGFVFAFFSLSGTKLPHYMIYGYTPLFLLMANAFPSGRRPVLLALWPAAFLLILASAPVVTGELLQRVTDPFVRAQLQGALQVMQARHYAPVVAAAALLVLGLQTAGFMRPLYRFIAGGTVMLLAVNFSILPVVSAVMQEPVREAALLSRKEGYKIVMWKVYYPSFFVYSESLAEKRRPEAGEVVLTTLSHLGRLEKPRILYSKYGIVLAKLPEEP
jgi:4-amino-4-deoxy-L-arabinose transferase-like glycosyltransferase